MTREEFEDSLAEALAARTAGGSAKLVREEGTPEACIKLTVDEHKLSVVPARFLPWLDSGMTMDEIATRIVDMARHGRPSKDDLLSHVVPHVAGISVPSSGALVIERLSPFTAVVAAVDRETHYVFPARSEIEALGVAADQVREAALANAETLLANDPGAEDEIPDPSGEGAIPVTVFSGNYAGERAYAFVRRLPEGAVAFAASNLAIVTRSIAPDDVSRLGKFATILFQAAHDSDETASLLDHPLPPVVAMFRQGKSFAFGLAFPQP